MNYKEIEEQILAYLKEQGFKQVKTHPLFPRFVKEHKGWYVSVNPIGQPVIGASREPQNFRNICYYDNFERAKSRLDNLDEYISICEERESE